MSGAGKTPEHYQIEDFVTDESFINYFFQLNADDTSFWAQWLVAHPENSGIALAAKDLLRSLTLTLPETEFAAELSRIRAAIPEEMPGSPRRRPAIVRFLQPEKAKANVYGNTGFDNTGYGNTGNTRATAGRGSTRKRQRSLIYTSLLLLILAGGAFLWTHFTQGRGRYTERTNDSGKPVVFTLTDGTVVTLAPQGVFRYPADFGIRDRKVYLEGEAQFQVSRDEARPFKVYEGDIVATVLGTVFNVKSQGKDSAISVELITGKLSVETVPRSGLPAQSILLDPDQRAVYQREGQKLYKEQWQSQHDLSLPGNHLVFRKSNFEEIARQVKAVFGVTIINESDKKNWRFTGNFVNTSAAEIAENICLVEGLHNEVNGDTILIK
jgi:transmembrane sensor